jgi:sugar phosphate isomerase/epimerase
MVRDVGSPALMIHLDTFHMNIEEKDQAAAILLAGKHLGHFHACGCDRGQPGRDHINWKRLARRYWWFTQRRVPSTPDDAWPVGPDSHL